MSRLLAVPLPLSLPLLLLLLLHAATTHGATLWDLVSSRGDLSSLRTAIASSSASQQIRDALSSTSVAVTLLAPSDAAFGDASDAAAAARRSAALSDARRASAALFHHVITVPLSAEQLATPGASLPTLNSAWNVSIGSAASGAPLILDATGCGFAAITDPDIKADNGVMHVVSAVLLPPASVCPDTLLAAEQRGQTRIFGVGLACRGAPATFSVASGEQRPVGLAADASRVFWTSDPTSAPGAGALLSATLSGASRATLAALSDPQHVAVDRKGQRLLVAERGAAAVTAWTYSGAAAGSVLSVADALPQAIAVDSASGALFGLFSVNGSDTSGSLVRGGPGADPPVSLAANLTRVSGLCLDEVRSHVYYVQGGLIGSLTCLPYGSTPCDVPGGQGIVSKMLHYPVDCAVDSALAAFGGPVIVHVSQANLPGNVVAFYSNGTLASQSASALWAPQGVTLTCSDA